MSLIECPECEKKISDKAKLCIGCGFPLILIPVECPECGNQISDKDKACFGCGYPLPLISPKSPIDREHTVKASTNQPTTQKAPTRVEGSDSEFSFAKAIIGLFFGGAIGMALGMRWGFGPIGALFISIGCALGCGFSNWTNTVAIILWGIICTMIIFFVSIFI